MSGTVKLQTVTEAAARLGMGRSILYRLICAGEIPHRVMPTGVIRFMDQDAADILDHAYRAAFPRARVQAGRRLTPLA